MTAQSHEKCEACGQDLGSPQANEQAVWPLPNPYRDAPRNALQANLRTHVEQLDRITGQVDALLESVQRGQASNREIIERLESLRQHLKPRHGLCIDPKCAACRVHEEVIKEHVLLYVDWKVPGTIVKLEQTRHRN